MTNTTAIRVTEVFHSIQGESNSMGWPTVFVRLTGCPLRCQYCDTAYAFQGGKRYTIDQLLQSVASFSTQHVTVTGGEPLAQKGCLALLASLCDVGYVVSLETSGALPIEAVDARVVKVVDFKSPGSGESHRNCYSNVDYLTKQDQVKLVLCDRADYLWARAKIEQYHLTTRCTVLLSPSHTQLSPKTLAEWILVDRLPVRMQVQIHKYIWGDVPGR